MLRSKAYAGAFIHGGGLHGGAMMQMSRLLTRHGAPPVSNSKTATQGSHFCRSCTRAACPSPSVPPVCPPRGSLLPFEHEAAGVDNAEGLAQEFGIAVSPIAGDTVLVGDDGASRLGAREAVS